MGKAEKSVKGHWKIKMKLLSSHLRYSSTILIPILQLTMKSSMPHFIQWINSSPSSSELPKWCAVDFRLAEILILLVVRGQLREVWGGAPDWLPPAASFQSSPPQTGSHQTQMSSLICLPQRAYKQYCFLCVPWCKKAGKPCSSIWAWTASPTIALTHVLPLNPTILLKNNCTN